MFINTGDNSSVNSEGIENPVQMPSNAGQNRFETHSQHTDTTVQKVETDQSSQKSSLIFSPSPIKKNETTA